MIVGVDAGPLIVQGGITGDIAPLVRSLQARDFVRRPDPISIGVPGGMQGEKAG